MSNISMFRGVDFTGVDWGERNKDIAARLGTDEVRVAQARAKFGFIRRPNIEWSHVDLTRPMREIAEEIGCSVDAVKAARMRYGITRDRIDWNDPSIDWSKSNSELAEELGCTRNTVRLNRLRLFGQSSPQKKGEPV